MPEMQSPESAMFPPARPGLDALRAEAAAAERDAKDAEYCDDVTATMPGGVLSRAWERRDRAMRALAEAEARS